jgi:hypothetical protein
MSQLGLHLNRVGRSRTIAALLLLVLCIALLSTIVWRDEEKKRLELANQKLEEEKANEEYQRLSNIFQDVRPLIKTCRSMTLPASLPRERKVLVWQVGNYNYSDSQVDLKLNDSRITFLSGDFPQNWVARSDDSQITVFMVIGERIKAYEGTYEITGKPAYSVYVDICVAYWPEKIAVGMGSFVSQPPSERYYSPDLQKYIGPEYGALYSDPEIANWILSLMKIYN